MTGQLDDLVRIRGELDLALFDEPPQDREGTMT